MDDRVESGRHVGPRLRFLSRAFLRKYAELSRQRGEEDGSMMRCRVIDYLYRNRDRDVFQRDLEEQFGISRSSVTGIVKRMERNGDICRQCVETDARLKKLTLTPRAAAGRRRDLETVTEVEQLAVRGLTREQLDAFFDVCGVIEENLTGRRGGCGCDPDHCGTGQGV